MPLETAIEQVGWLDIAVALLPAELLDLPVVLAVSSPLLMRKPHQAWSCFLMMSLREGR
jgi:hypothetical protein